MDNNREAGRRTSASVIGHTLLLLMVGTYIAWSVAVETVGANIGLGLGLLALGALAVPWTLPYLLSNDFTDHLRRCRHRRTSS